MYTELQMDHQTVHTRTHKLFWLKRCVDDAQRASCGSCVVLSTKRELSPPPLQTLVEEARRCSSDGRVVEEAQIAPQEHVTKREQQSSGRSRSSPGNESRRNRLPWISQCCRNARKSWQLCRPYRRSACRASWLSRVSTLPCRRSRALWDRTHHRSLCGTV